MKKYLPLLATLIFGILLGAWLFGQSDADDHDNHEHEETTTAALWTCSMDPQVRMSEPGPCPICGMDLVPLTEETAAHPDALVMSEAAQALAEVQTTMVMRAEPSRQLQLTGRVRPDEASLVQVTARFPGRIEKLYVNVTGQVVQKGQPLASIYSPALLAARRELLEAAALRGNSPGLYEAARRKLRLWDLSEAQIDQLEKDPDAPAAFDILSPSGGTVLERMVSLGDYLQEGMPLLTLANLNSVWVELEAYEADLPWLKLGSKASLTFAALPGKTVEGKVSFISPILDPGTRTAVVRVSIPSQGGMVKPDMFAKGLITSTLPLPQGTLVIPASACLWTGEKTLVYVSETSEGKRQFRLREVRLGAGAGEMVVVTEGLEEGEEIVSQGAFQVDAAAQLAGKPSMMQAGRQASATIALPSELAGAWQALFAEYLATTQLLTEDKGQQAQTAAAHALSLVSDLLQEEIDNQALASWNKEINTLIPLFRQLAASENIDQQRKALAPLSLALYHSLRVFPLASNPVYYHYCPMAFNNQGAYWLSNKEEILNPYFGASMLHCGENRDVIK